jgi:hypothetical protein
MSGAIPPLSQYAFMALCSVKKQHKDKFTFYLCGWASISACFVAARSCNVNNSKVFDSETQ